MASVDNEIIEETRPSLLDDLTLVRLISKWFADAKESSSDWRRDTRECFNFVAGHQWNDEDIQHLEDNDRPVVTFNRIGVIISAVMGIEANQRQETTYLPREGNDNGVSEALSEVSRWLNDYADIESEEADAFEDVTIGGMGWTETRMDYEEDLDGKLIEERVDPIEMYWDSASNKRGLKDRRFNIRERKMTIQDVRERWENAQDIITATIQGSGDDSITLVDPEQRYNEENAANKMTKNLVAVKHTQWYELEPVHRIADKDTGKVLEFSEAEYKEKKNLVDQLEYLGAVSVKQKKRVYYYAFTAGNEMLETGKMETQSGFTFNVITGKHDKMSNVWYGMVRDMKDPAQWANKFFSQIMDILASNSKGGVLAEENSFSNQKDAEEDWAKNNAIISMKPNAIKDGRIREKPPIPYPAGLDKLMEFSIGAVRDVVGINLEVLGMADREQSGVLEETRKKSAYTILATLFDSLRAYRKVQGRLTLEFIKTYIPETRLAQILGEDLKQYAPAIKALDLNTTDVIVSESPQSENNKNVTWAFLMQLVPSLIQAGLPVPPDVLEYSPLPKPLVEKWMELIESQGKPSPEKIAQQEAQMQALQAEIKKAMAEAGKTEAEIGETQANMQKIIAEIAETQAKTANLKAGVMGTALDNAIKMHGDGTKEKDERR